MNTETNKEKKHRFFNLPLALTIGAMLLLGITTTTLGFLLKPERNKEWDDPAKFQDWPEMQPGAKPFAPPTPRIRHPGMAPGKTRTGQSADSAATPPSQADAGVDAARMP